MLLKLKVLFVLAEAYPLAKTGGLGDVGPALARALIDAGVEVRILMPGYREAMQRFSGNAVGKPFRVLEGADRARLVRGRLPEFGVPTYLVDCPSLYDRPGGPYGDENGHDWWDNALRFGMLCRVASMFASGSGLDGWKADIVHGHDWHAGLTAAYTAFDPRATAATVFTIHNLVYQGNFDRKVRHALDIDSRAFHMDGLEFYGHLSFMKAGLFYSDRITTVSPTYAGQIVDPEYGCGMDGLLRHRSDRLSGIMNGVDHAVWDPRTDRHLPVHYSAADMQGKARCKTGLQNRFDLPGAADIPLVGMVGRMTHQKGWDLLADAIERLLPDRVQFVLVGNGDEALEAAVRDLATRHPGSVAFYRGHDESLAHLVFAGADLFTVPSRFEPAGLTQMYAQCYGTPPVVRRTGGLVDSVTEVTPASLEDGSGAGFFFDEPSGEALAAQLRRAIGIYRNEPGAWRAIQANGMRRDFSWDQAARRYAEVYEQALDDRRARAG